MQVDKDQYKQTVKVPLYGTDGSPGANIFYPSDSAVSLNMVPVKETDPVTKETSVLLQKRTPISGYFLGDFSGKLTGTIGSCIPIAHATTTMLGFTNIVAVYDAVAVHPLIRILSYGSGGWVSIGSISNANTTGGVDVTSNDIVFITEIEHASGGNVVPGIAITWKKSGGSYSDGFYALSSAGAFTAASLTKITAASFPVTLGKILTGPFQQLNGIFYVMDTQGIIYGSGGSTGTINDITLWDSNNTIRNRMTPDAGVGIFRYKHHLVAFNNSSIEFFNDVGNPVPASALANTEQAFIHFGAQEPKQILNVDDTLYWVAAPGQTQSIGIYKLDGYTPVKISTPAIDLALSVPENSLSSHMGVFLCNGKQHLSLDRIQEFPYVGDPYMSGVALPSETDTSGNQYEPSDSLYKPIADLEADLVNHGYGGTPSMTVLCYNITDGLWWRLGSPYDANRFLPCGYTTYSYNANYSFVLLGDTSNASLRPYCVFYFNQNSAGSSNWADETGSGTSVNTPYACIVQTRQLNFGTSNRKRISRVDCLPYVYEDNTDYNASVYLGVKMGSSQVTYGNSPNVWLRYFTSRSFQNTLVPDEYTPFSSYATAINPYRWNNIGMTRSVQFTLYTHNSYPLIVKDMDVTFNTLLS